MKRYCGNSFVELVSFPLSSASGHTLVVSCSKRDGFLLDPA